MILQGLVALALTSVAQDAPPAAEARARQGPSAAEVQAKVAADKGCKRSRYPDLQMIMYRCEESLTFWYFTVPGPRVPPGYVRRALVEKPDGSMNIETLFQHDGTEAQHADFDAWTVRLGASLMR